MNVLKCKMCGGLLNVMDGKTVCECEYCGTQQTVPVLNDEKKLSLFTRANRLRATCEFDKAAGVYETIVSEYPEEAEAYWGLVLCKFGIEYVDDPATGKKIPTCHRSSYESIMDDGDFEQTLENADPVARKVYREEAKVIDGIQKSILEISAKEDPYDVFICYKETDEEGNRTVDSVIAQDVYDMLTANKYRVFFARISLEDNLGTAYEPYIFAALNSARIMLAFGTSYDYYNAVWVKNEWSRFLSMMNKDKKKVLIPCYKNIDAYDVPKEFKHLQAQDMGKVGAMQDLLRGIMKILPKSEADGSAIANAKETQSAEVTYKKEISEKIKRKNGTKLINRLQVVASNSGKIAFPDGKPSTKIDLFLYSHLSMQMILNKRIGYSGTAVYNFSVFTDKNEWITNISSEIDVLPQYDRFAKVLILKGDDGSRMDAGKYRLEGWINDSQVAELNFELIDTTAERLERKAVLSKERAALLAESSRLKGLFTGKRRKEIEERLSEIDREMRVLG